MSLTTREQSFIRLENLLANRQCRQQLVVRSADGGCTARGARRLRCQPNTGRFLITFSRDEKVMIERLEENSSEQLRLRFAVELNGERKRHPQ